MPPSRYYAHPQPSSGSDATNHPPIELFYAPEVMDMMKDRINLVKVPEHYAHPDALIYKDRQNHHQFDRIPVAVNITTSVWPSNIADTKIADSIEARIEAAILPHYLPQLNNTDYNGVIVLIGDQAGLLEDLPDLITQASQASTSLYLAVERSHLDGHGKLSPTSPYYPHMANHPQVTVLGDYAAVREWLPSCDRAIDGKYHKLICEHEVFTKIMDPTIPLNYSNALNYIWALLMCFDATFLGTSDPRDLACADAIRRAIKMVLRLQVPVNKILTIPDVKAYVMHPNYLAAMANFLEGNYPSQLVVELPTL